MAPLLPGAPIGVYIHVPFCTHICPYCDFNTYSGQEGLIPAYVEAVIRDLHCEADRIGARSVESVFFGGGTPSLLPSDSVAAILEVIGGRFAVASSAEITLEANPNGLTLEYLLGLRAAGINRLSIGLQTTDRRGLRVLGRMHEAVTAEEAVADAIRAGFDRISLDMIFGWPGQTLESWGRDLDVVLGWSDSAVKHLSLYSLIVEPGTPMADAVARGIVSVPDDDAAADLYELAIARLAKAGWHHYEIANFAAEPEHQSVHNRIYWRNGEYLGIGAGAHGRVGSERTMRHLLPATYIRMTKAGDSAVSNVDVIDAETAEGETMMLGLRLLDEGILREAFAVRHGRTLDAAFGSIVAEQVGLGLLLDSGDRVRLTERGMMVANGVVMAYLP
jgi:putative oxygen-independent coproporphyrinogen III oxidase